MGNFLLAVLLAAGLLLAGCREEARVEEPVRPVRVYTLNGQAVPEVRTFPGKVEAAREASLAFRVSGQLVRLDVKEGDKVVKGRLIAMLDQRDFKAAVADLEARLAGAEAVLSEAERNIERNRQLVQDKIISPSAFDAVQRHFETSRADALSLAQSLKRARLNLQYTRLTAPFSGTIAVKHVDNHEYVQAKEPIVQLEDMSELDVVIEVPESVWIKGMKNHRSLPGEAGAGFESYPGRVFPLRLKEFESKANPDTQTYEATLGMANPDGLGIQPGMTAQVSVRMPANGGAGGPSIPVSSVAGVPDGPTYVWVLGRDNTVHKREVEVGRIFQDMFHVVKGLRSGETIVVAGVNHLREGQKVSVLEGRIGGRR